MNRAIAWQHHPVVNRKQHSGFLFYQRPLWNKCVYKPSSHNTNLTIYQKYQNLYMWCFISNCGTDMLVNYLSVTICSNRDIVQYRLKSKTNHHLLSTVSSSIFFADLSGCPSELLHFAASPYTSCWFHCNAGR